MPISRDYRLCHFCSYNVAENEAHIMVECSLFNPVRDKFQSLSKKAI